jgi:predicted nucleic acid-binding Zn ribbon protein
MTQPPQQAEKSTSAPTEPGPLPTRKSVFDPHDPNFCAVCGAEIKIMIFRGTNVCGELCRKIYDKCIREAMDVQSGSSIPGQGQ